MSSSGFDLGDQSRRTAEAQGSMYDALEGLGDTIDRGHELLDDIEEGRRAADDALNEFLREAESDYRTVEDFAENYRERQGELNDRIKDNNSRNNREKSTGAFGTTWQIQPGWRMYQQQGCMWQQQGFGWNTSQNDFWSNPYQSQNSYGQSQQQTQDQNWNNEFFGTEEEESLDEETGDLAEPVDIDIDEPEEDDYEDGGENYDEPNGSVDMEDSWNPDASFDYEAEQSTENVSQSFSFSGSGFEPSGSITMEQSAGGETQYFEASF